MNFPYRFFIAAALLLFARPLTHAQDLQSQPVPFTAYLDFKALAADPMTSLPIWLASVEFDSPKTDGTSAPAQTTFRLRFRKMPGINDQMLMRLYFDDLKEATPVVTAWTELGECLSGPKPLGNGIGLPASESVTFTMAGVDYIDITVPGSGSNVQGAFLSSVKTAEILKALDFELPATLADPFQGAAAAQPGMNDAFLYGRVKATLDASTVKLSATDGITSTVAFELASQPLLAVVTFEILNADPSAPPQVIMNNRPLGTASLQLPDLADPAFQGEIKPLLTDMQFHYAGWLKCQKVVPGSSLQAGTNSLSIQSGDPASSVAIRAMEVQLKYNWKNLDYTLKP